MRKQFIIIDIFINKAIDFSFDSLEITAHPTFAYLLFLCPGSAGYSLGEIFFLPVIPYNLHCIIFSCIYYKIFSGVYAIL